MQPCGKYSWRAGNHNRAGLCFFAAISGSSPGTVAAVGDDSSHGGEGYDRDFSAALTASAGSLGVLIPPSIPMVLYCIAESGEVSIGEMFMAGFIPGFLYDGSPGSHHLCDFQKNGYKSDEENLSGRKWLPVLRRQSGSPLPPSGAAYLSIQRYLYSHGSSRGGSGVFHVCRTVHHKGA